MNELDDGLVRYVQLQTMQRSQEILFEALVETLLEMKATDRLEFCQSLQGQILEALESTGATYSAHAGLLNVMCRGLFEAVLGQGADDLLGS